MITDFEKIPPLFAEVYRPQFETWAREFRKRGSRCAIVFNPVPGKDPLFDQEGRPIAAGAWMQAEVDYKGREPRVIIRPATEHDQEMIARHCREMAPHVLQ